MSAKHEWRKSEKNVYIPKNKPEFIVVPDFNFITIRGEGSPADKAFTDAIGALYSVAYPIKMQLKKMGVKPRGYSDFTVYPWRAFRILTLKRKSNLLA